MKHDEVRRFLALFVEKEVITCLLGLLDRLLQRLRVLRDELVT